MFARLIALLALTAAVAVPSAQSASLAAPSGLRAFLLRADEPIQDSFPRTPAFAWTPYDAARSYDFELSTSKKFDETTIAWSTSSRARPLRVPVVSVPLALPWMTGTPYALYAHVRAHTASGVTRWSRPFGFNMRWRALPEQLLPTIPGLVRWKPVEGATSYEVWFVDAGKIITTTTNVADEREYYSFHADSVWTGVVQWRVRAVRKLYGSLPNGLPVVSYGPWSQTYVSTNPTVSTGPMSLIESASDVFGTSVAASNHSLTPGFAFTGNMATNGQAGRLFRVYVATDAQCVNVVFTGSVVGSPAYAPRTNGPIALPSSPTEVMAAESAYPADGPQNGTLTADLQNVTASEASGAPAKTATGSNGTTTTTPPTTSPPTTTGSSTGTQTTTAAPPSDFGATGAPVDLWDSGWPAGRYYWTVVPVREVQTSSGVRYVDAEVPQDACAAGRRLSFGKTSQPVTTAEARPYLSGLSPSGYLVAARTVSPSFYRAALIAWEPAPGATGYEVQWSKTRYPWKAAAAPYYTAATSMLLEGLPTGVWYYRLRGIDPYLAGPIKQMTWSTPQRLTLIRPRFAIDDGSVVTRPVKK
jgi:hypothetical protein